MNRRGLIPLLLTLLLLTMTASEASALDLGAPVKALGSLFGKKGPKEDGAPSRATVNDLKKPLPKAGNTMAAAASDTLSAASKVLDDVMLTPEPYYYETLGRRDPFASLVGEEYLSEHVEENLQESEIYVRGILWGENDRFALVETAQGESTILRKGDRIGPYSVTGIEPDGIVLYASLFGVGKSFRIPMVEGKGNQNARGQR